MGLVVMGFWMLFGKVLVSIKRERPEAFRGKHGGGKGDTCATSMFHTLPIPLTSEEAIALKNIGANRPEICPSSIAVEKSFGRAHT